MKTVSFFFILMMSFQALKSQQIDAVSGATKTYYPMVTRAEVFDILKKSKELKIPLLLCTTNEDGTPNAAYMGPSVINDSILVIHISKDVLTRKNLDIRKVALMPVYIPIEGGKNWKDQYKGARLVLHLIEDQQRINELSKKASIKPEETGNHVFLEIVKIIPFA